MATDICTRRLTKELAALRKDPLKDPRITVAPNESNMLEMHYVIEGSKGTPYEGGVYHGKLLFPKEYPLKPPGVMMLTPSGRFQPGRRLCLSMSDFHPETWNPMWSVSTILTGLYSFMIESSSTMGSIETTMAKKRKLALTSLEYNVKNSALFCKLFPEYVERYQEEEQRRLRLLLLEQQQKQLQHDAPLISSDHPHGAAGVAAVRAAGHHHHVNGRAVVEGVELPQGLCATLAGIVAILSIVLAMRFL